MKHAFLTKAQENLAVAEWAYTNGHYNATANRTYYAAFQAAVATLAHFGLLLKTGRVEHRTIQNAFATELIHRRKLFPNHLKSVLPTLQEARDEADYEPQSLSKSLATKQLRMAREFIKLLQEEIEHD
jgi:uncharacterized protein (UPF0332 family)